MRFGICITRLNIHDDGVLFNETRIGIQVNQDTFF